MMLAELLEELRSYPPEETLQPELKPHREAQDLKIREDQDLADGAVLQAVVEPGSGDEYPVDGDLVFIHVTISNSDGDEQMWTTRSEQGGTGQPLVFMLGKGARAPRGWEIAIAGMHRGARSALKLRPSYGFHHPTCKMVPPPGVRTEEVLAFDLQLIDWVEAKEVRTAGAGEATYKRVLMEGSSFESPRPPFEVSFHLSLRALASDGAPQSGKLLFSSEQAGDGAPITATLGAGQLHAGVEDAVCQLCQGESALFILPASAMQPPSPACSLPAPPAKALQIEAVIDLHTIVQVRDMTGTGEVTKRRLREGQGEFPIDCPLNDTTVRLHYRVRGVHGGVPGPWLLDTRTATAQDPAAVADQQQAAADSNQQGSACPPLEIDTGCGEAPEAVEMCAKLMVPGELALVAARTPKYAYEGRSDCPEGLQGAEVVEWEVELIDFDKEGHWQVMSMEERFTLCERVKSKSNALVKAGRHAFARPRYERLLRLMESTRDYDDEEEMRRMDAYKLAVLLNLALCDLALNEPAKAITWCDKALEYDDKNAKAYFRRGRALSLKGDYEEAEPDLRRAAELDTTLATDVEREIAATQKRAKAAAAKQKTQFKNFFDRS